MSPVTMTTSSLPSAAVHQMPAVVGQPKQYTQVLNGPAAGPKITNGTHFELKKEISDAVQGTVFCLEMLCTLNQICVGFERFSDCIVSMKDNLTLSWKLVSITQIEC